MQTKHLNRELIDHDQEILKSSQVDDLASCPFGRSSVLRRDSVYLTNCSDELMYCGIVQEGQT